MAITPICIRHLKPEDVPLNVSDNTFIPFFGNWSGIDSDQSKRTKHR